MNIIITKFGSIINLDHVESITDTTATFLSGNEVYVDRDTFKFVESLAIHDSRGANQRTGCDYDIALGYVSDDAIDEITERARCVRAGKSLVISTKDYDAADISEIVRDEIESVIGCHDMKTADILYLFS